MQITSEHKLQVIIYGLCSTIDELKKELAKYKDTGYNTSQVKLRRIDNKAGINSYV